MSEIFSSVKITEVRYGENFNSLGQLQQLYLDVYEPEGDIETGRPLIILGHGGAFMDVVDHHSSDITRICKAMARKGYVCVSYDYREVFNPLLAFNEGMIKAIMQGVQDGKAAIRYFMRSAEEGNPYNIDAEQVIMGGVSAGAFIALHLAYVTNLNLLPWPYDIWTQQIGGIEGNSGSPGYTSEVLGVINIAGALVKPYFLDGANVPVLNIHGTADPIVPYGAGKPFGIPTLMEVYGSKVIHATALEKGIQSILKAYQGRGHVPFMNHLGVNPNTDLPVFNDEIFDSTISHISDFAYSLLKCNPANQSTGIYDELAKEISIFPNPSSGPFQIRVPEELADSWIRVFSMDGTLVYTSGMIGTELIAELSLAPGIYTISIVPREWRDESIYERLVITY